MAVEDSGLGGEGSVPESPTNSSNNNIISINKNKMKFLCSHGGNILPRAGDGQLKYVGGETRAVVVPRDVTFSELKNKLASISEGDTILKYQLLPDDLEALVSVKNDEDIRHMVDEYDRHIGGTKLLRAFLFPSSPIVVENHTTPIDHHTRYVDAVNGIIRPGIIRAAVAGLRLGQIPRSSSPLRGSTCTSPRSPDSTAGELRGLSQESAPSKSHQMMMGRRGGMHRVHSSPNVSSFNQLKNSPPNHHHFYHYNHPQQIHRLGHLSPTGTQPERLYSVRSMNRSDAPKFQAISSSNGYYPVSMVKRGSMQ